MLLPFGAESLVVELSRLSQASLDGSPGCSFQLQPNTVSSHHEPVANTDEHLPDQGRDKPLSINWRVLPTTIAQIGAPIAAQMSDLGHVPCEF